MEDAVVTFIPATAGRSAVGVTDALGQYVLTTQSKDDGAMPGQYQVTIAKFDGAPPAEEALAGPPPATDDITNEYPADYNPEAQSAPPPSPNLLPAQYADPGRSGLRAEVKPDQGANAFDFNLEG